MGVNGAQMALEWRWPLGSRPRRQWLNRRPSRRHLICIRNFHRTNTIRGERINQSQLSCAMRLADEDARPEEGAAALHSRGVMEKMLIRPARQGAAPPPFRSDLTFALGRAGREFVSMFSHCRSPRAN